jgi:hypothetical protein
MKYIFSFIFLFWKAVILGKRNETRFADANGASRAKRQAIVLTDLDTTSCTGHAIKVNFIF